MRNNYLFFFAFILLSNITIAQTYTGEDIILNSQAEVNAFGSNNYEEVQASIEISGDDISDLEPLKSLKTVEYLTIRSNPTLATLSGLDNITTITSGLNISGNSVLKSLAGLEQLNTVNNIIIKDNPELTNLEGLITNFENITFNTGVSINSNQNLTDVSHLGNFKELSNININNNNKLTSLQGLENIKSLYEIYITNNSSLSDCSAICTLVNQDKIEPPLFLLIIMEIVFLMISFKIHVPIH